jgi:uncharacterized membrane protein YfcA
LSDITYVVLVVAVTALLQAISGFGFALLSVPLFALRIDVHEAVVLSSCIGTISSGWQTYFLRRSVDAVLARRYIVASLVGIPAGFALFILLSDQVLRLIVGVAVLFGTLVVAFGGQLKVGRAWERVLGVLSGALLIATSTNGPPIVLAMQAQRMPMLAFRSTLARIFFVSGLVSVVLFLFAGEIDASIGLATLLCVPVMTISVIVGNRIAHRLAERPFRALVLILLVVAGTSSLISALG